jgi:hypothetical protein
MACNSREENAADLAHEAEMAARRAQARDVGLLIRDMIEDTEFIVYSDEQDESGELGVAGYRRINVVDCSDPGSLVLHLDNGQRFTVRISCDT